MNQKIQWGIELTLDLQYRIFLFFSGKKILIEFVGLSTVYDEYLAGLYTSIKLKDRNF
jgi:hypothetical protein